MCDVISGGPLLPVCMARTKAAHVECEYRSAITCPKARPTEHIQRLIALSRKRSAITCPAPRPASLRLLAGDCAYLRLIAPTCCTHCALLLLTNYQAHNSKCGTIANARVQSGPEPGGAGGANC